jgi:phosphoserine phosphatase RsbU/P
MSAESRAAPGDSGFEKGQIAGQLDRMGEGPALLATLLQNSPQAFLLGEPSGQILLFNPAFLRLTGCTEAEVRDPAFRWTQRTAPEWREQEREALDRLAVTGRPQDFEKELVGSGGDLVRVRVHVNLYRDEQGRVLHYALIDDVTSERRAQQEREQVLAQLQMLGLITDVALSTLELGELLDRLLHRLVGVTGADAGLILLLEDRRLVSRASAGLDEEVLAEFSVEIGEGFAGKVAARGGPLYVRDAAADPAVTSPILVRLGLKTMLGVPLLRRGELVGVLHIDWFSERDLDERVLTLLELAADRCALAISNAQLFEQTRQAERLGEALNQMNELIHSGLSSEEVIERVVVEAASVLGARACLVFMREDKAWALRFQVGLARSETGLSLPTREAPAFRRLRLVKRALVIEDPSQARWIGSAIIRIVGERPSVYAPLVVREEVIGALVVTFEAGIRRFTGPEIDFTQKLADSLALGIDNARLYQAQLSIAETLQESLFSPPERLSGVRFSHLYRSATAAARIGGDFYDLFEGKDGLLAMMVGDISGHGVAAAARAAFIRSTIRAYTLLEESPAAVLALTNRAFLRTYPPGGFATVFMGLLDPSDATLVYCSAGHPPPVLVQGEQGASLLDLQSPVVGVFDEPDFRNATVRLAPQALLTLYTDGVIEARRGRKLFGERRLMKLAEEMATGDVRLAAHRVLRDVIRYSGGRLADDLAVVAIRLEESMGAPDTGRGEDLDGTLE